MAELIVKSALGIAVSYLLYYLLIRENTRLKWIRFYFIVSVAASLIIPVLAEVFAIRQQVWIQIPEEYIRQFLDARSSGLNEVSAIDQTRSFSFANLIMYIYLAGVFIVLSRFLAGFFHLLFLSIKHGIQKVGTDRLVIMHDLPYPFSFLHLIFINRQTLSEGSNGAMLQHERVHIRQWHSLDLILLELLVAFQWFNPFAWFFRRSVKELHEYLADEEVLRHQKSTLDYQLLLFNQACGTGTWKPVNGFSSLTKKRILMITNNKKTKRWFAAFISVIVVIVAIQSLSRVNIAQDPPKKIKSKESASLSNSSGTDLNTAYLVKYQKEQKDINVPLPLFYDASTFQETVAKMGDFVAKNNNLPSSFKHNKITKGIFVKVMFNDNGKVSSVDVGEKSQKMVDQFMPIDIDESAVIVSEIERILKSAPNFTLQKTTEGQLCNGAIYFITFKNNKCNIIPCKWYIK